MFTLRHVLPLQMLMLQLVMLENYILFRWLALLCSCKRVQHSKHPLHGIGVFVGVGLLQGSINTACQVMYGSNLWPVARYQIGFVATNAPKESELIFQKCCFEHC